MASGRRRLPRDLTFTFGRLLSGRDAKGGDRERRWAARAVRQQRTAVERKTGRTHPRNTTAGANDHDAELLEEAPRPLEQVFDGSMHRDGDEREPREDRDRVPVNRPEQAR